MSKLKGHKSDYGERWTNYEGHIKVGTVLSTPAGGRLREIRDEIRREHKINRYGGAK